MPQLYLAERFLSVRLCSRESELYVERERCIHGFLMLAMMGCLFLSCSALGFVRSTSDTAEEQLGNQRSSRAEWLQ